MENGVDIIYLKLEIIFYMNSMNRKINLKKYNIFSIWIDYFNIKNKFIIYLKSKLFYINY